MRITRIGNWIVNFHTRKAYRMLSCGFFVLVQDEEGRQGVVPVEKILPAVRKMLFLPETFEDLENLPFVEMFGTHRSLLR